MRGVFADAGYWIALFNAQDAPRSPGRRSELFRAKMVLVEFLNAFSRHGPRLRAAAARAARALGSNPHVTVVAQTANQFAGALARYEPSG